MASSRPRRKVTLHLETMEDRAVPAVATLSSGTLTIDGSDAAETIRVRQKDSKISVDSTTIKNGTTNYSNVPVTWVTRIVVNAKGGNDTIDLRSGNVSGQQNITLPTSVKGGLGDDLAYGSSGRDSLYGEDGNDKLYGMNGDDRLDGANGNDSLYGSHGNDYLSGGYGNDSLDGYLGNDTVYGSYGNDTIYGGEGNDYLDAYLGNDVVYAWTGNDTVYGGEGNDSLNGYDGNDTLHGHTGNDTIDGGAGNDSMTGYDGNDTFYGGTGNDYMHGGYGNDYFDSWTGNDTAYGNYGNDTLYGGEGNDYLDAYVGNDTVYGYTGNDTIYGGEGNDLLDAWLGNDTVYAYTGNDTVYGGEGNDYLSGSDGADKLYGYHGDDTIDGGAGNDYIKAGYGSDLQSGGSGIDTFHRYLTAITGLSLSGQEEDEEDTKADEPQQVSGAFLADNNASSLDSMWDVVQEGSPTCSFLAALAGTADWTGTSNDLVKRITYNSSDDTYNVKLYVNGTLQTYRVNADWNERWDAGGGFWVALYQKAFLKANSVVHKYSDGTYMPADDWYSSTGATWRNPGFALKQLTNGTTYYTNWDDADPQTMSNLIDDGWVLVAGTDDANIGSSDLLDDHSYFVTDVYLSGSTWYVKMYNPWGEDGGSSTWGADDGIIAVDFATWQNDFYGYDRN